MLTVSYTAAPCGFLLPPPSSSCPHSVAKLVAPSSHRRFRVQRSAQGASAFCRTHRNGDE